MAHASFETSWAVAEHAPAPEEYWGQDALVALPTDGEKKAAVAPSVAAGRKKFADMFKRNSDGIAWRIAFKTSRAWVTIDDQKVPAGFPTLAEFWRESKSLRAFKWGLSKYMELYPDAAWVAPDGSTQFTPCVAGQLRKAIVANSQEKASVGVQRSLIRLLVRRGLIKRASSSATPDLRKLINLERMRKAQMRALAIVRIASYWYTWQPAVPAASAAPAAPPPAAARQPSGRESPSLKRQRV